jgi:NitT/TauT family transport system permease protein
MGRRLSRPDIIIVGMLTIGLTGALMSWGLNRIDARFASSKRVRL